jgi:hypothetical protein
MGSYSVYYPTLFLTRPGYPVDLPFPAARSLASIMPASVSDVRHLLNRTWKFGIGNLAGRHCGAAIESVYGPPPVDGA